MRRILLAIPLCAAAAAIALPTSAALAKPKPKPKPLTYKTGTYSAKAGPESKFDIVLKRASCASAPGQANSSLHLCVALSGTPTAGCTVPINLEVPLSGFAAPVQLPTSGKVTEQAPVSGGAVVPGGPPTTGQSSFSVAFTKKGTASGYVEVNMMIATSPEQAAIPCSSGKVPFTAKLG
jgi:hypothetical protein